MKMVPASIVEYDCEDDSALPLLDLLIELWEWTCLHCHRGCFAWLTWLKILEIAQPQSILWFSSSISRKWFPNLISRVDLQASIYPLIKTPSNAMTPSGKFKPSYSKVLPGELSMSRKQSTNRSKSKSKKLQVMEILLLFPASLLTLHCYCPALIQKYYEAYQGYWPMACFNASTAILQRFFLTLQKLPAIMH